MAALVAMATSTSAHFSILPPVAAPNANTVAVFRVGHSFPGAVTTNISIDIPIGLASVKPQQVAGWKVALDTKKINGTDAISRVTWYDGSLPDELFQDFGLQLKVGDLAPNTTLYFPVTQETTPNGTLAWTSVPDASGKLADPAHPAPKLTILPATSTPSSSMAMKNSSGSTPAAAKTSTASSAMGAGAVMILSALSVCM
ncbi:hypothetical protein DYB32_006575 [Aphanomyces invadans]|nr:hypothetical protein DYB32_006575 [Aphanomyces invadans]